MADFPQNLDDGDDFCVFPHNQPFSSSSRRFESIHNRSSSFADDFGASGVFPFDEERFSSRRFEDLTRQFSAFSLLQRDHHFASVPATPPPMFEILRQPIHSTSTTSARYSSLSTDGGFNVAHNVTSYETRDLTFDPSDLSSFQYHQHQRLAQNRQLDNIMQLRARLRQLQNQQQQSHSQLLPNHRRSRGHVGTNFISKFEGTGVFIPRTIDTTSHQSRRRQVARNRREAQSNPPRSSTSRNSAEQHEDCYSQVSPEMALPHDWTY